MQPTTTAEKELLKENLYRNKVQEILRESRSSLQEVVHGEDKSYAAEGAIIDNVMRNERNSFLTGLALSGLVFASVRFGPRYLVVKINPEKAKKLAEADAIAEKANTRWMQKTFSFLFEISFGAWAGWRGYNMMSSQNTDSYDTVSKIPLCAGRSKVSEKMCSRWIDLVHKEIPPAFFSNLDVGEGESKMKDPKRWQAVRAFADNCIKRKVYEDSYRKQNGLSPEAAVTVPQGGVPDDILLSLSKSKSE